MTNVSENVSIYTDGACSPNPGPGGYGAIIARSGRKSELSGGFRMTTNNRMEVFAAIQSLKAVEDSGTASITIYSDSRYLVNMFNGGYAAKWRANGWRLASKQPAVNTDLWGELLDLTEGGNVQFEWVKGHSEHPENVRCDEIAVAARQLNDLPTDEGYGEVTKQPAPTQLDLFGIL
jgi:ribonuclease HI